MELTVRRKFNVQRFVPDVKFETFDIEITDEVTPSSPKELFKELVDMIDFFAKEYIERIKRSEVL